MNYAKLSLCSICSLCSTAGNNPLCMGFCSSSCVACTPYRNTPISPRYPSTTTATPHRIYPNKINATPPSTQRPLSRRYMFMQSGLGIYTHHNSRLVYAYPFGSYSFGSSTGRRDILLPIILPWSSNSLRDIAKYLSCVTTEPIMHESTISSPS